MTVATKSTALKDRVSKRMQTVPPSGIRRFFEIAATMEDVISLGIGEPDSVSPKPVIDSAIQSLRDGNTSYTANAGLQELREGVSAEIERLYGVKYDPREETLITVGVSEGMLLAMLAGFIAICWISERAQGDGEPSEIEEEIEEVGQLPGRTWVAVLAVLAGILALVFGSNMLIEGATGIARAFGISEAVIGVTLVAIGTSLPELAAVIVAAIRNHADVALGNVLGSNVFNVFGMLGLTAVIEPLAINRAFLDLDMWVMLGVSALLLVFLTTGNRLNRGESLLLLAGYAAYVVFLLDPGGLPAAAA